MITSFIMHKKRTVGSVQVFLDSHVPIFVMRTPVLPETRCTVNFTKRAHRCPPMPPRSLETSVWLS